MTSSPIIELQDIHKSYFMGKQALPVLKGVSLGILKNEYVALMGPSGSGKSTLMNILGCLDTPTSGKYILNGQDVSRMTDDSLADVRNIEIGFVFQQFNLIPNLTARENVLLPLEYARWPKEDRLRRADEMLALVGLSGEKAERRPAKLSGGEQQRVAIARAFAAKPQLILADEPTGSLDKSTGQKIVELLRSAASTQRATVLVVTHDDKIAQQADRRLEIDDGILSEVA